MKKSVFLFLGVAAVLLIGCASSGGGDSAGGPPPEIEDWLDKNGEQGFYAVGVSDLPGESDAEDEVLTSARQNLDALIEVHIASVSDNAIQQAEAMGQSERAARFRTAFKYTFDLTLPEIKTYGPYKNGKNKTYVIVYLDRQEFETNTNNYVNKIVESTDEELDAREVRGMAIDLLSGTDFLLK